MNGPNRSLSFLRITFLSELCERVRKEFSENEVVDLTYAVATINAWNRLAISRRAVPGQYRPAGRKASAGS